MKAQPKSRERRPSRIPKFENREQAARWFDTHDMADYQDEFKTVRARFSKNLSEGITIRLDSETLAKIRSQASKKGIGPTTLIRMWIMERLATPDDRSPR